MEGNFVRYDAGDGERKAGLMGQMLGAVADSFGNFKVLQALSLRTFSAQATKKVQDVQNEATF